MNDSAISLLSFQQQAISKHTGTSGIKYEELEQQRSQAKTSESMFPNDVFAKSISLLSHPLALSGVSRTSGEQSATHTLDVDEWILANDRRIYLLNVEQNRQLTNAEESELSSLTHVLTVHINRIAPLPFNMLEQLEASVAMICSKGK